MRPTMRAKRRYLVFRLVGSEPVVSQAELKGWLSRLFLDAFGELGCADLHFKLIIYDEKKKTGVICCRRERLMEVRAALALAERLGEKNCRPQVTKIGGTIRTLKEKRAI